MTPRQLPDLRNDVTFSRMANEFANDQRTIQAVENLRETFKNAFLHGAMKGIKIGYVIYCKERGSFDYVTPDADSRYSALLSRLTNDKYARDTIKRVYYDLQLDFLDKTLHDLFFKGAQYGLTQGYGMGEQGNKNKR